MQLSNVTIVLLLTLLVYSAVQTGAALQRLRGSEDKSAASRQKVIGGVVSILVFALAVAVTGWRS